MGLAYARPLEAVGRAAAPAAVPARRRAACSTRPTGSCSGFGVGHRPGALRRRAASEDDAALARAATRSSSSSRAARSTRGAAGARDLPRDAAAQRRARRDAGRRRRAAPGRRLGPLGRCPRRRCSAATEIARAPRAHDLRVAPGSRLAAALGTESALGQLLPPPGDRPRSATASWRRRWADDGVIEAVEVEGDAWVLGVQWELQESWKDDPRCLRVFEDFVSATARRGARPAAA